MQKIGTITLVQIQREPLKSVQNPNNTYDDRIYRTAPIQQMAKLQLTANGIIGITAEDQALIDVHNTKHPQTRNRGDNKLSFGFIQHYQRMQERFGEHITVGDAGENILIDADIDITHFDTTHRLFIQHADTQIELKNIAIALPCRPFTIYCAQDDLHGKDLKTALQFLDNGTRGYYAAVRVTEAPYIIQAGDELWMM